MANRRIGGGMGGGPRNQSFSHHHHHQQQPFRGGGVNPWQGGSNSNQGLISNPQQLALALSSLLQPQQQSNNPPSLLSLNTSPAFNNYQNRDFGRFGGGGPRGRDMRRHEPYNKNRGGGGGGGGHWNKNNNSNNRKPFHKKSPNREQQQSQQQQQQQQPRAKKEEVKQEVEDKEKEEDERGDESKEGQYKGVPAKYLNCFVCNKQMWDGESMGKHVRGRAHRQMLESMEESMHLTVNILREHMRITEEKKAIEWDRMQRISKKFKKSHEPESHCNMCDLKFMGKIVAHRKTDGHQRLKRYLHPNCEMCEKEFSSRMDWVEHRLTPEHLQKLHQTLENKEGGEDGDLILDEGEPDLQPILEESLQMEADHPILELTDDVTGMQSLMPAYKPDRAISIKSLVPFSGFRCEICYRSFENEELGKAHLKTVKHYHNFIAALRAKFKEEQTKKEEKDVKVEAEAGSAKEGDENGDTEMYDPEEACNETEDKNAAAEGGDPSDVNMEGGEGGEEEEEEEEYQEEAEEEPLEEEQVEQPPPPPQVVEVKKPVAVPQVQKQPPPAAAPAAVATGIQRGIQTRRAGGAVKNGAGPKSKKMRK